ncbi:IS630 transposase-related protein [Thermosynechococcus vestitus]|uniref:IS630 transposase-related protein n=1 Tax=Thermosynechococcus vestitus TaxID=146786 RepID=UPI0013E8B5ED
METGWEALAADVAPHPDNRFINHAQGFGVEISTMSYALDQRGITGKNGGVS